MLQVPVLAFSVLSLFLTSVSTDAFEYNENGKDWTGKCATGFSQSPIDIEVTKFADNNTSSYQPLSLSYVPGTSFTLLNAGHDYKLVGSFGTLTAVDLGGIYNYTYSSLQFHFHAPSEHTINQVQYPLEMHIVHQLPSTSNKAHYFAVLGVLFELGNANPALAQYITTGVTGINLDDIFGNSYSIGHYYMYMGSLTTPPCTEAVNWYIYGEIQTASQEQLDFFINKWANNQSFAEGKGNNREVQHRYHRMVVEFNNNEAQQAIGAIAVVLMLYLV